MHLQHNGIFTNAIIMYVLTGISENINVFWIYTV